MTMTFARSKRPLFLFRWRQIKWPVNRWCECTFSHCRYVVLFSKESSHLFSDNFGRAKLTFSVWKLRTFWQ